MCAGAGALRPALRPLSEAPTSAAPRSRLNASTSSNEARASFTAKIEPMLARTASTENGSQLGPPAPRRRRRRESAVRRIVPRLPGSRTPSSAMTKSPSSASSGVKLLAIGADHGLRVIALGDLPPGSLSLVSMQRTPLASACGDQSAHLRALKRRRRRKPAPRARRPSSRRLARQARALGQEQAGFSARLLGVQRFERLDQRVCRAGDLCAASAEASAGGVRTRGISGFRLFCSGVRRAQAANIARAVREK